MKTASVKCMLLLLSLQQMASCDVIILTSNITSELDAYIADERPWCPPSSEIFPCTCDGPQNFLMLSCDRITDAYVIYRATRSVRNIRNFGKFSLTNSRISNIESNILGFLRFEYIYARKNTIKIIEPEFFDSSRDTLKRLEMVHNDIEKFPFKELPSFPMLEHINLKYNSLKTIPDDAFGKSENNKIKTIDLSFNKINHIGSNAFKYLANLERIDLRFNKLTVINNLAFSTFQANPKLRLNLANNKIMFISDGAFENQAFKSLNLTDNNLAKFPEKVFRDLLREMSERRSGLIYVGNNRFRCTCEKVEWIIRLPTLYKLPVLDFECSDKQNKNIQELTLRDAGCAS